MSPWEAVRLLRLPMPVCLQRRPPLTYLQRAPSFMTKSWTTRATLPRADESADGSLPHPTGATHRWMAGARCFVIGRLPYNPKSFRCRVAGHERDGSAASSQWTSWANHVVACALAVRTGGVNQ